MITRRTALLGIASIPATAPRTARSASFGSDLPRDAEIAPGMPPRLNGTVSRPLLSTTGEAIPPDCDFYTAGGSTWARRRDGEAPNGLRFYTAWEVAL